MSIAFRCGSKPPLMTRAIVSISQRLDHLVSQPRCGLVTQDQGNTLWHGFVGVENGHAGFGHTAIYLAEPSGWQVEYHSKWKNPPKDTDIDVGDFSGYCYYHCV